MIELLLHCDVETIDSVSGCKLSHCIIAPQSCGWMSKNVKI